MRGFIIEYVTNGWADIEVQLGAETPTLDANKEILTLWEFENAEEKDRIIDELRDFRLEQRRHA